MAGERTYDLASTKPGFRRVLRAMREQHRDAGGHSRLVARGGAYTLTLSGPVSRADDAAQALRKLMDVSDRVKRLEQIFGSSG